MQQKATVLASDIGPCLDLDAAVRAMPKGDERSFWEGLRRQVYVESGQCSESAQGMPYRPSETLLAMLACAVLRYEGTRYVQFRRICEAFGYSLN